MNETLLDLVLTTEKQLIESDKQLSKISVNLKSNLQSSSARLLQDQRTYQDMINRLIRYKVDYRNYINNVHKQFEDDLAAEKRKHINSIKSDYDSLVRNYNSALQNEKNPGSSGVRLKFNFVKSFYNSITDVSEKGGGFAVLINMLIVLCYLITFGLIGYTIYIFYTSFSSINDLTIASFYSAPYYKAAVWGALLLNFLTVILRTFRRSGIIKAHNESLSSKDTARLVVLKEITSIAHKKIMDFKTDYKAFFDSNGSYKTPALNDLVFSKDKTFSIFKDARKKINMNFDTSLYKDTYPFYIPSQAYF